MGSQPERRPGGFRAVACAGMELPFAMFMGLCLILASLSELRANPISAEKLIADAKSLEEDWGFPSLWGGDDDGDDDDDDVLTKCNNHGHLQRNAGNSYWKCQQAGLSGATAEGWSSRSDNQKCCCVQKLFKCKITKFQTTEVYGNGGTMVCSDGLRTLSRYESGYGIRDGMVC